MTHSPSHTALAWREMAEAPRDGGDIIVYDPDLGKDDRVQIAFWNDILNYWQPLNDNSADPQPICWMPKPPPPGTESPQSINSELLEAAKSLSAKLKAIHDDPRYKSVWQIAQLHSCPYDGPTYVIELDNLDAAISNAEKANG